MFVWVTHETGNTRINCNVSRKHFSKMPTAHLVTVRSKLNKLEHVRGSLHSKVQVEQV